VGADIFHHSSVEEIEGGQPCPAMAEKCQGERPRIGITFVRPLAAGVLRRPVVHQAAAPEVCFHLVAYGRGSARSPSRRC
jgi:hypothetical protein